MKNFDRTLAIVDAELIRMAEELLDTASQEVKTDKVFDTSSLLNGIRVQKSELPKRWLKETPQGDTLSCYVNKGRTKYYVKIERKVLKDIGDRWEVTLVEKASFPSTSATAYDPTLKDKYDRSAPIRQFRDLLGW